jgi:hypothetical protein
MNCSAVSHLDQNFTTKFRGKKPKMSVAVKRGDEFNQLQTLGAKD